MLWGKRCDLCGKKINGREYFFRGKYFCSQEHTKTYIEKLEKPKSNDSDGEETFYVACC